MRLFRLFLATVLLASFWLTALPARAGTVTWSPPVWSNRQGTNRKVDLLNRQDCLNDATVQFSVTVAAVSSGAVLELWVGTGCDTQANRNPANKQCVQVTTGMTANTALKTVVTARFQDMIKPYGSTDTGTAASCDLETSTGQVTRSLFFVVYNSGSTMAEAMGTPWVFKYDIKAPGPPTGVTAGGGENSLVVNMTAPSGESNLLRYHFYCSPLGSSTGSNTSTAGSSGTGATAAATGGTDTGGSSGTDTGGTSTSGVDAGGADGTAGTDTGGTAGTDTGGTGGTATSGSGGSSGTSASGSSTGTSGTSSTPAAAPGCSSDVLIPDQAPPADAIDCGSVGAQGITSGETRQVLENDATYAVAVATEDNANNIGVLSQIACGTPQDITGFFEAYRDAGGKAGGGYCSFAPARNSALAWLFAVGVAASALVRRRR